MNQTENLMSDHLSSEEIIKEAARELQELKFALDESTIVAITDLKGKIIFANQKFCEISQYSLQELLGQDHRIINSGYHSKEFMRHLWQTIKNGKVWKGEIRNKAKDGSFYWVDTTIVPFFDGQNIPYQFVAIRHDITVRKMKEESFNRLGAQMSSEINALKKLNNASANLWRIQELNKGLKEMLDFSIVLMGADKGNIRILNTQKQVLEIIVHQGFKSDFLEFFREVSCEDNSACARSFRNNQRIIIEDVKTDTEFAPYRKVAEEADFRSVVSSPLIGNKGDFLGVVSLHFRDPHHPSEQDLNRLDLYIRQAVLFMERLNIENKLKEKEEDYRRLFETMTEGFAYCEIIRDFNGKPCDFRYLSVNPSFEKHTRFKPKEIVNRTFLECFPGSEHIWIERYGKTALTGEPDNFIEWFSPLNRWYQVSAFQTEPGRFAVIFEDYTERKQIEEQIRSLPSKIIEAQEKERKFISQEIHDDFGQMLVALKFYLVNNASHLITQYPELKSLCDGIKGKINEITEKARHFSHSLAPPDLKHIGLVKAIKDLLSTNELYKELAITFVHRNLRKIDFESREIIIYRIIQEALSNVLKHSEAKKIFINLYLRKDKICLSITDDGKGFDLKAITKSNRTLGLFIMRERVKLMDGNLKIKTRPGEGTQIRLNAPVKLVSCSRKESEVG